MRARLKSGRSKFWISSPPWLILAAAAILVPLFIFMTYQGIRIQEELTAKLLAEKGDALIRSFEAGIRTGEGLNWGDFQKQKLLIETAQQPGIDYLVVTDPVGLIVADSEPSQVGDYYRIDSGHPPSKAIRSRRVANSTGADTFEVYRFLNLPARDANQSWIIFVGLDMGPVMAAQSQNTARLMMTALILLLVGFAGFVSLFLAQGYRAARSSLSRMKLFSDTLIENMPIGLIGLDQDDRVAFFNREAETILESPSEKIMGKKAAEVLSLPCGQIINDLRKKNGILQQAVDCPVEGKKVPLDVVATVLKDEEGKPQGAIVLFRDMTEIKRLQREIERSQRLASVGSLAAGIAHEIRNPLSSIKGFATYFKERYRTNPADVENAEVMIQEVERLNRVIGQLLEFSRPLNLKKIKTSLEPVLTHALKLIEGRAKDRGIAIRKDVFPGVPDVTVDPDQIKQVFLNLFLNALDAMGEGGLLSVVVTRRPGEGVSIAVADTGAGIDRESLTRIFDPYYTTKSSGTGLGLAIVHKIVEAHGGGIRIESEPGKGTLVTIALPL
jgi:two-component system, NtrC family, sensor histidine kinase HydH